jgi:hypothetical protein
LITTDTLKLHFGDDIGIGEILDAEEDGLQMTAEHLGQALDGGLGERFEIGNRRREGLTGLHRRRISRCSGFCEE